MHRQPLEDRKITISRAKYTVEYPCSFMFVASMNPCPCGYYNDPTHKCVCTPGQIQRYLNKISGPLLDRIDIQIEITPVPFKDISRATQGESSASIRERVIKARQIQEQRFREHRGIHCNAQMSRAHDSPVRRTRRGRHRHAARRHGAAQPVSPSLQPHTESGANDSDLDASPNVQPQHLAEAISYRNLDRGDWAER